MDRPFDLDTWRARVRAWWQDAARDLPGTCKRYSVSTAYGLLTASALLPLLEAYANQPGAAVTTLVTLVGGVGANLVANLVQGAYDKATAPQQAEEEVQEDEALRAGHRLAVEQLDALAAAQAALGDRWEAFYTQLLREDRALGGALHIETGGGAYFAGPVDNWGTLIGRDQHVGGDAVGGDKMGGDKVGRDQFKIELHGPGDLNAAAAGILRALRRPDRGELQRATRAYLRCLLDRHFYLQLKGMGVSDRVPVRLPLLDLYVPLQARVQIPEGETWRRAMGEGEPAPGLEVAGRDLAGRLSEPRPALELLAENDGLIVLGDPGAGKTTFLKYLALKLALGEGEEVGLDHRLPVLVPLSAYANALAEREVRLDDFIADYLHDVGADLPVADLLREALDAGRALILLDGLDEVRQARLRHVVVERVVDFFTYQHAPGNKFVLTSRIVGYREVRPQVEGLVECTLVDLDEDEIAEFVGKWTAALERQAGGESAASAAEAERERRELLSAVRGSPGVRRLAANPLLLTILALMKRQGVTLPERRVELYDQYVRTLLSSWNRARGLGRPPARDLDVVQTVRVLAPLALWMHETSPGVGLVRRGELERELVRIYAAQGEPDPEEAARRFLADVREYAGLLLERGAGQYGFIHLTFEEYLAAVGIGRLAQEDVEAVVDVLAAHAGEGAWREVSLLAVGYLGIVQQWEAVAGGVIEELIARGRASPPAGEPGEATVLAGEATLDAWPGGVTAQCKAGVERALVQVMQEGGVAPRLRRGAGLVLGRLGWAPDDLDAFIEIPAGPFLYGMDKERRKISYRYWIGKYPVTNRQYARFIDDQGYDRHRFWSEAGWAWRVGTYDSRAPVRLSDWLSQRPAKKRDRPFWWDDQVNHTLFPVVGVCWFEAEAYCNWLTGQLRAGELPSVSLPDDYAVCLPKAEEWERAVRGTDGRVYPWGNEFPLHSGWSNRLSLYRSNVADAWVGEPLQDNEGWDAWLSNHPGLAGTTAVCTYPQGVNEAGLWDGAGNVWEWTASWHERAHYARVLCGGSWDNVHHYARCAFRNWDYVDNWGNGGGFRVSVSLA